MAGLLGSIGNIAKGIEGWKDAKGKGLMGRLKGVAGNISGERQDDMLSQVLENQEQIMQQTQSNPSVPPTPSTNGTGGGNPTFDPTQDVRTQDVMNPNTQTSLLGDNPNVPTPSEQQLDKLT